MKISRIRNGRKIVVDEVDASVSRDQLDALVATALAWEAQALGGGGAALSHTEPTKRGGTLTLVQDAAGVVSISLYRKDEADVAASEVINRQMLLRHVSPRLKEVLLNA
ncbi:hypothetical protein FB468_0638 [Leucobacter komagatae]|uniref:Uncharacterized protein n=1 Tax=Leucobacter komagatae TaxID=55969 RepID=A0A542Y3H6_9MICO|nr:hypothetical protein [Leucobacter komagatae]TQL42635.1 hypothetical protein FB468_0638 [Leucobacter komagatae]